MRTWTHSLLPRRRIAGTTGIGRVLLALAALVLLAGCATGSPRGSLARGWGLHSRPAVFRGTGGSGFSGERDSSPGVVLACGGVAAPPGWPDLSAGDAEALLAPFLERLRADAARPRAERHFLGDFDQPRIERSVGVWKQSSGLRFADVLVIEEGPSAGRPPRVETFSFKSRDLSRLKGSPLVAQMIADAREALGYYGGTLDIRRPSLQLLLHEVREVPVRRVRLLYEGGPLKPKDADALKVFTISVRENAPGVEVLFQ